MPERRWTLVVTSHGRWGYLWRAIESLNGLPIDRLILSVDGPVDPPRPWSERLLLSAGWEVFTTGRERKGLTANLAQAWGALTTDDEWVFHVEEDFLIHDAPLDEMADTLEAFPQVANMVLVRQPWSPPEIRAGSVLRTQDLTDRGGWLEHTGGFWLNPFVAHASLLRSLQPGVEQHLTNQCRARGLTFGYWGGLNDPPRCEHIGALGGMNSPGWKP